MKTYIWARKTLHASLLVGVGCIIQEELMIPLDRPLYSEVPLW
jgi:hypothetical protein